MFIDKKKFNKEKREYAKENKVKVKNLTTTDKSHVVTSYARKVLDEPKMKVDARGRRRVVKPQSMTGTTTRYPKSLFFR